MPEMRIACSKCRRIVIGTEIAADGTRCKRCAGEEAQTSVPRTAPGTTPDIMVIGGRPVEHPQPKAADWGNKGFGKTVPTPEKR